MRWSAEKLRWLALGGALLLAGVLAAFLGLANYRAGKIWQRILKRNGVNLVQESNGITWSQSVKGRTVFTLHAERSTPHGNGIYSLHNAVLILYGKDGRNDRIHGNEFEYDQTQGILRAIGEVHMDLQAPAGAANHAPTGSSFSFNPEDEAAADPAVIHVLTSGLVYLRKLDVAATKEPVEFSYRGLRCHSQGAEFDSGPGILHLLADVHLAGRLRDAPFTLLATRADLDRTANTIEMAEPSWASGDRTARADHALVYLHKDGTLQTADGEGHVELRSSTRTLSAPQVHTEFAAENRPQRSVFTGGVQFAEETPTETTQGSAAGLTLTTDPRGVLNSALAEGGVEVHAGQAGTKAGTATREMRAQRVLAGFVPGRVGKEATLQSLHMTGAAQVAAQSMRGAKGGGGQGGGAQGSEAQRSQPTHTTVNADDLLTTFLPEGAGRGPQPQRMVGTGHTVLAQSGADGGRQVSEGDTLDAQFAQRLDSGSATGQTSAEVSTAVQTGHVVLHAWPADRQASGEDRASGKSSSASREGQTAAAAGPSVGHAQRAVFQAGAGTLTLSSGGGARAEVETGSTQLQAPEIVLHQGTGDGEASGGVAATTTGDPGSAATHVLASRAKLLHSLEVAEFFGTDASPARMWQATSQVDAAQLVLDARQHTLTARPETAAGRVHGVFATEHAGEDLAPEGSGRGTESDKGRSPGAIAVGGAQKGQSTALLANARGTAVSGDAVRVAAQALDYSDLDHEATFRGDVRLRGVQGTVSSERGVAFLQSALPGAGKAAPEAGGRTSAGSLRATPGIGGRLDRFVLLGDVRLVQPGRVGQGQQLTYTAATDRFVLTGAPGVPPRVVDAQQGVVTGETLVFGAGDRSVVAASAPGTEKQPGGKPSPAKRAHTETDIKR